MLGVRHISAVVRSGVLLASLVLASLIAFSGSLVQAQTAAQQGTVKLEWLGHEFYRLTSPDGVVVVTSPWLTNDDGPVELDELTRTDLILIPNAHNDDMGSPIEVAAVSGARVLAPGPLGRWLTDNGLPQDQFVRTNMGGTGFRLRDTAIRFAPNAHDNTLPNGTDGGPAASYFVNFDNGVGVFYPGHSTMVADLALYAAVSQPQIAILGLTDPVEFAEVARLMATNNPKLRTIIPSHIRPGAPILNLARRELERVGLGEMYFLPELRRPYEY